jgi:uncharacterized protein DUF6683
MRALTGLALCLGLGLGTVAHAQWDPQMTADLGRGMGQIALSQSILSGTRRIGTDNPKPSAVTTQNRSAATLTYIPDPRVSEQTRTAVLDTLSRQNPTLRAQMDGALNGPTVLRIFDRFMSLHGFSSRNVADDMAMSLLVSWEIVTGNVATPGQIRGTDNQVRGVFLNTPQLRAMTNLERQQMAENIAYQIVIGSAANRQFRRTGDQAQLAQLRQTAETILRQRGVDLARLRLTERGFVKAS